MWGEGVGAMGVGEGGGGDYVFVTSKILVCSKLTPGDQRSHIANTKQLATGKYRDTAVCGHTNTT